MDVSVSGVYVCMFIVCGVFVHVCVMCVCVCGMLFLCVY
jgi:hypothetical protein